MEIGISRLFGIEKEERSLIGILLFQSVFLGIFYGVFNITAHAIFLSRYDETDMARAYIISGLAGSALTYIYSVLQARLRFSSFSVINLVFILIITLCLWFLVSSEPEAWVVYAIFVMFGPLFILAMLGYWGTAGRLFTLRQGRRLFGIIDTGLILGIILSSFSIPALLSFNVDTKDILLISALGILIAVFIQLRIINRNKVRLSKEQEISQSKAGLKIFRENKYVRAMGVFIALSVLVVFFVQYSFMAVTKVRYPVESDMARFLGFFEGSMMVFTLLIKTFIFSYLIKNQGLKVTLAISPILIGLFTIIAVLVGSTRGFVPGTSGFMIFFLILALSRLFSKALKDSVETPAFKVLYQTLGEKFRYSVQSAIDGTVNEIAALASGLLLTGLGALAFIKFIHFSWVLTLLTILWVIFALRLYREYRESIKKTLDTAKADTAEEKDEHDYDKVDTISSSGFYVDNKYFDLITRSDIPEIISGNKQLFNQVINKAERTHNPDILPLLRKISSRDDNNNTDQKLSQVVENIEATLEKNGLGKGKDLLSTIEESDNRRLQLQAIMAGQSAPLITDLMRLIRDQDNEIIRETLYIAGKFKIKELLPEICECLEEEAIARDAYAVLCKFGEDAFPAMTGHYYRSSGNITVRRLLLRLFAETGGGQAVDFLLPGIWSINRYLRKESVQGLIRCGYRADDDSRNRLMQEVQDIIGLLTWNLSAQITLRENEDEILFKTVERDTNWWTELLFDLLSLVYDKNSLDKIKENLESGTVESVNFALEMIDIVVDDEIKPRLTALLDVVSLEDKVKNLFQFYPGSIPEYDILVQDLINKDYNHIGIWTKACAIRSLYRLPKPEDIDFLIALLFSVNRILREEACRYLSENFEDIYPGIEYRLPPDYKKQLEDISKGNIADKETIHTKVIALTELYPGIFEDLLINLAEKMALIDIEKINPDKVYDFIIWPAGEADTEIGKKVILNWSTAGLNFEMNKLPEQGKFYYVLYIRDIEDFMFYEPDYMPQMVKHLDNNIMENAK